MRVDLVVALRLAREHDQIAARRPQREVVVSVRERRHLLRLDVHDPEALAFRTERPVDEAAAVRRHRREPVVVRPARQLAEPAAVGIDHRDLRAAFRAILRLEKQAMKAVEEGVEHTEAEDDALAVRGPLRAEDVARRIPKDDLRRDAADVRHADAGAHRLLGRPDEREPIACRAERGPAARERQLVAGIPAPGLDPGLALERDALVKHHLRAIGRPRRGPNLAFRAARSVRIVNARSSSPSRRM